MYRYAADGLLDALYHHYRQKNALASVPGKDLPQVMVARRQALAQCLGMDVLRTFQQPLSVIPVQQHRRDGYTLQRYDMAFMAGLTTPLYLVVPDKPILAKDGGHHAVVYLNGHGGGCADALTPQDQGQYHMRLPILLAQAGYLVAVPELAGFGDVVLNRYKERDLAGCYALTTQLQLVGVSMGGLRCLQAIRTVDWLLVKHKVSMLAAGGISGGGLVTMLLCALESRLDAGMVFCYANTFYHSVMAMRHCVDNYMPGILAQVGDIPDILSLAAPMPLLLSAGDQDHIFPIEASRQAFLQVQQVYHAMGAVDRLKLEVFSGGHELSTSCVFDFLAATLLQ